MASHLPSKENIPASALPHGHSAMARADDGDASDGSEGSSMVATASTAWQRGTSGQSEASKKRVQESLATDFIRAPTLQEFGKGRFAGKQILMSIFNSQHFSHFMALVIIVDAYCICNDIDSRAAQTKSPSGLLLVSYLCLSLYTIELALNLLLNGRQVLRQNLIRLDLFLVLCGYTELLSDLLMPSSAITSLSLLRILRLVRVFRLLKLLRNVRALRELSKLVKMMSTCMKALFWSFCFCFMVMTVWAMLIVEVVHPLVKDLEGMNEECARWTSSVMEANLLLFRTVIAGDSWGEIAVPVIEAHPSTALIFVGAYLTIVFGVLNLIVAVVVDQFADARERDVLNLADEMERDQQIDQKYLQKIFDQIDKEGKGELSFNELLQGARKNPEFQSRLRVMDIDQSDLTQLFAMIDVKGTGQVDPEEFIQPLSRWVHESKTANRFVKYNVMRTMHQNEELRQYAAQKFDILSSQIQRIATCLGVPLEAAMQPTRRQSKKFKGSVSSAFSEDRKKDKGEKAMTRTVSAPDEDRKKDKGEKAMTRTVSAPDEAKPARMVSCGAESAMSVQKSQSGTSSTMGGVDAKTIARRLSVMEEQQLHILEGIKRIDAGRGAQLSSDQDHAFAALGLQSQSLSSLKSNNSGGVLGGTAARVGSEATNSRSLEKATPNESTMWELSQENVKMLNDQEHQDRADFLAITERDMDVALRSAMEVVEDVLQNAASTACVRAQQALRFRLQNLLSPTTSGPGSPEEVDLEEHEGNEGPIRLARVRQRAIGEVNHHRKAGLRPDAPAHPRMRSLGEDEPVDITHGPSHQL